MKVLVQWATSTMTDWVQYDINSMADVRAMPRKPVPGDSPLIDDQPGWISAVNIQGVVFSADHLGFAIDGNGHLVVGKWNDDAADWPAVPFGWRYTFGPLAPDPNLPLARRPNAAAYLAAHPEGVGYINGEPYLINTQQTVARYMDASVRTTLIAAGELWAEGWADALPWADFPKFSPNNQLHGVWLEQSLWDQHQSVRSIRGWREWGA